MKARNRLVSVWKAAVLLTVTITSPPAPTCKHLPGLERCAGAAVAMSQAGDDVAWTTA